MIISQFAVKNGLATVLKVQAWINFAQLKKCVHGSIQAAGTFVLLPDNQSKPSVYMEV